MILEVFEYEKNISPISVFKSVREHFGTPCALLESAMTDDKNQFSLIAAKPIQEIVSHKKTFPKIRKGVSKSKKFPKNFPFSGGLIGYFNFEIFNEIEKQASDLSENPHAIFYEFSRFFAFDHAEKKIFSIQTTATKENFLDENKGILEHAKKLQEKKVDIEKVNQDKYADFSIFDSEHKEDEFTKKVDWAKQKILDGEIFQMIISNQFKKDIGKRDPLDFYETLRVLEPATHLVFYDFGEHGQTCIASPEILGSKRGKKLIYSPIAGTRYRGKNAQEDEKILQEMINDPKENAEHDMLLDLGRNDLGKICKPGSIVIEKEKYGRFFANVMHLVSDISGTIKEDFDSVDFFKSIFPAGTLSGAPKIRAMQLISEIENCPRNLYGGAAGYFSADGDMEFCIAIRSFFAKNGIVKFRTGAGIVQDSESKKEWLEVHNKARSLCKIFNYTLKND